MFAITEHQELKGMLDRNDDCVILDVLPEESFLKQHLPGAINISFHNPHFETLVEKLILDKSNPVVIYSANKEDLSSAQAAEKLAEMGYKNVSDYENGIEEWVAMGYGLDQ